MPRARPARPRAGENAAEPAAGPASPAPAAKGPVESFDRIDLDGAMVLLAFPTAGSAASIAAQYLVRNLRLPLVGHLRLPELSGLIAIQDGRVTSPVRIYGGQVQCRIGRDCPRIYLVTTEVPLPPLAIVRIATALEEWASAGRAHMLLVLEAVVRTESDDNPDVFVAAADPAVLSTLKKAGLRPMERALIAGITAHILLESETRSLATAGILVEASREHPDGRAAAALVEAVAKLVPDVVVDAGPLMQEAKDLEKQIQRARDQMQGTPPAPQATFI